MVVCYAWAKPAHPGRADGPHVLGGAVARQPRAHQWLACHGVEVEGTRGGGRGASGKVRKGAADRGGRASMGRRGGTDVAAFQWLREVRRRLVKLHATLRFCEREEEVRPSPNGENGEESARRQLSPRRGDGVGGAAESSVRGDTPRVEAVGKATGRSFARGALRSEDGGGGEQSRGTAASMEPFMVARWRGRGKGAGGPVWKGVGR
jgi:hypothetical protein